MLDCQNCSSPCFDYEETGVCPREAQLPPAVCPMFEDFSLDSIRKNIAPQVNHPP